MDALISETANPAAKIKIPGERSLLIVEDDQSFSQRLAKALEQRGFIVTTADSVADGLLQVESPEAAQILLPGQDQTLQTREAMPGTFMMPDAPGQDAKPEKCMTVCARWGEDCLLINKGAGGMQRKCRRTCKQFAEECF